MAVLQWHAVAAWTRTAHHGRQKGTCFCWSQMQVFAQEVFRYFSFRQKHVSRSGDWTSLISELVLCVGMQMRALETR